ncbi:unnamed protein product [Pleuronectes platessa]|uniref:Uncharacterized protein n=1 Tax=Pleuronectes platessa TaxID=8262 RepID=A0A9N7Y4J9_PLEPL|nr:unnamed protein product [Pleuronectes platessa]
MTTLSDTRRSDAWPLGLRLSVSQTSASPARNSASSRASLGTVSTTGVHPPNLGSSLSSHSSSSLFLSLLLTSSCLRLTAWLTPGAGVTSVLDEGSVS